MRHFPSPPPADSEDNLYGAPDRGATTVFCRTHEPLAPHAGPSPRSADHRFTVGPAHAARPADLDAAVARLKAVYQRLGGGLFLVAYRLLGDRRLAEDVLHDVFLRLWNNPEYYDEIPQSLRTRLHVLVRTQALDVVKNHEAQHQRQRREAWRIAMSRGAVDEAAAIEDNEIVRRALHGVPDDERQPFLLAYAAHLSYREVATTLGISEGTAQTRIRAGRFRLRRSLAGVF